jgi:ABC-type cobalamin/Fe3+-siderophores transport system ATPase subunit
MSNYNKYDRGSEWRKWDFHVHTKGTRKNDSFTSPDFDTFCEVFFKEALENNIEAIGITDYFSIENYRKVLEYQTSLEADSIFTENEIKRIKEIFIFPNVELRMMPSTNRSRMINIHCLFNPKYVDNLENDFFSSIEHSGGTGTKYKMNKQGMIDLGKSLDDKLDDSQAYIKGINNFAVSHSNLQELLDSNYAFRENTLIVVSNSNQDGASAFTKHYDLFENDTTSSLDGVRQAIYKLSDCIFSPNENDRQYFLGKKSDNKETVIQKCGSLKPCIHGSDAHTEQKLFKPDHNRYCWIKSNLTFEGLKQILYEPEDRVMIQLLKPDNKNDRHIISNIQFQSSDNLFGNQSLKFNDNLNAIIGGKSSGKSLLLHSIAESVDPEQVDKTMSKLKFEGYKFEGEPYDFTVKWKNGDKDILSDLNYEEKSKKITYIPQLYINYLAEKNNKEELNKLIGNILLQDEEFKVFYEEKRSQILYLTQRIDNELSELLGLRDSGQELSKKIKEIGTSETINQAIKRLETQISDGQKASNLTEDDFAEYSELIKQKEKLENQIRTNSSKSTILNKFNQLLEQTKRNLFGNTSPDGDTYQKGQLDKILDELGDIPEDLKNIRDETLKDFEGLIGNLNTKISTLGIKAEIERFNNELKETNDKLKPYLKKLEGQKELKKLTEQLENEKQKKIQSELFEKQFENTKTEYFNTKSRIHELLLSRYSKYQEICDKINETKKEIGEEITLECSLILKKEKFLLFEQANKSAIAQEHFFNDLFIEELVNYEKIPELFSSIVKVNDNNLILKQDSQIKNLPIRQNITLDNVFKGIIEDNFEFDYKVTYKNDELLHMSPGKKGTVLLILFLQISSAEHPILIDQPEDNLDNRTIYDLLCTIIKDKKKDRQIIIVSHNANLVVATDSENIIVANQEGQDPDKDKSAHRFEYVNGGLEYTFSKNETIKGILYQQGIKEHVCDVLEGGNEAFKQREKKYALK